MRKGVKAVRSARLYAFLAVQSRFSVPKFQSRFSSPGFTQ